MRELAGGNFLTHQRNVVLVGGTGTGTTHLAIAIARACIRAGARGRFFHVVDRVNKLAAEGRAGGRAGWPTISLAHGLHLSVTAICRITARRSSLGNSASRSTC